MIPPALFFFLKIAAAIRGRLWFHGAEVSMRTFLPLTKQYRSWVKYSRGAVPAPAPCGQTGTQKWLTCNTPVQWWRTHSALWRQTLQASTLSKTSGELSPGFSFEHLKAGSSVWKAIPVVGHFSWHWTHSTLDNAGLFTGLTLHWSVSLCSTWHWLQAYLCPLGGSI